MVCDGLPFGYKAVKEAKDTESYEVDERKTKAVGRGRRQGPEEQK